MSLDKRVIPVIKKGNETFTFSDKSLDFKIIDFWKWSASDLISNATRGRLAEFIVAKALDINTSIVRDEWQAYDLITDDNIKIEVKSAAYIQSWSQKSLSKISFSIKKSRSWDPMTGTFTNDLNRSADVYIFALLNHKDKVTINPLNLNQWLFYVLTVDEINNYKRSESSITLKSLEKICSGVNFNMIHQVLYSKIGA